MKKKKKKGRRVFSTGRPTVSPKTMNLLPEEAVNYVRQAERHVIPMIKDLHFPPAVAFFLLAQYTQVLATGDERITPETAMSIATNVLALWQEGLYTPSPDYPYTLEETLQDQQDPFITTHEYAESFRPLQPTSNEQPRGKKHISAGLVKHPETQVWQIWLIIDGPCDQVAAHRDASKAQQGLQEVITLVRNAEKPQAVQALCHRLWEESDDVPKQIPFDMMHYLLEHLDRYTIRL